MGSAGAVQYERVGHAQGRCAIVASFKRAEYAADFIMLARRVLADRPVELAVFEAYHVDDLEWLVANKNEHEDLAEYFRAPISAWRLVGYARLGTPQDDGKLNPTV
jgi:hypothetical protein